MKKVLITFLSLACIAGGRFANAGTHVWSGAQGGLWSNPANWSSGGAPSANEAAPVIVQFPSTQSARRESTNNIANLKLDVLGFYGANYHLYGDSSTLTTIMLTGSQPPFPYAANLISGYSATNYIDWWLNLVLSTNVSILVGSGATPGLTYTVDASTDLKTWLLIGTAKAASPGGELIFIDPDAPNFPYRFYRFLAP